MSSDSKRRSGTAQGLAALALWASTVALSRSLAEQVGSLGSAAVALALGAALSAAATRLGGGARAPLATLGPRYLYGCGALFVGYQACLYGAIGLAPDRPTTLVVALLNYLWPSLMVALSVPILGQRARAPLLALGCALAVLGTGAAVLWDAAASLGALTLASAAPLALAALAGLLWALYSNLARLFGPAEGDAVPLFLGASAVALGLLRLGFPEPSAWSPRAALEVAALAAGPMAAAYTLWDRGVRGGDPRVLGVASYLVPVASLAIAALWLGVAPGPGVLAGGALVVLGAVVSRASLRG